MRSVDRLGTPSFLATHRGKLKAYIPNSAINPGTDVTGGRFITFKDKVAIK